MLKRGLILFVIVIFFSISVYAGDFNVIFDVPDYIEIGQEFDIYLDIEFYENLNNGIFVDVAISDSLDIY